MQSFAEKTKAIADAFRRAGEKVEGGADRPSIPVNPGLAEIAMAPGEVILSSPKEMADFVEKGGLHTRLMIFSIDQKVEKEGKTFQECCDTIEEDVSILVKTAATKASAPKP